MGRRKFYVIGLIGTLSIVAISSGFAQGKPHSSRNHPKFNQRPGNSQQFKGNSGTTQRFYQLSPEDRQTFKKNAERWLQMSPEERTLMRSREQMRRQRIQKEADAVLRDSGLSLDQSKKNLFQERYLEERRRIDRELRQEYEMRRQQQLERLKKEFQPQGSPGASSTTAPSISVTPNR